MEEQKEYLPAVVERKTLEDYMLGTANSEKLTEVQKNTFYQIALINNLNPFKREIYAIPRWNSKAQRYDLSIVTGYEVYLDRAEATGNLDGWEADYVVDPNGKGDDYAFCTIYRKDMKHPITQKAWLKEFYQETASIWNTKKRTMLVKCAIAITFRRAFRRLQGLPYTQDEMPIDVTPEPILNAPEAPKIDDHPQGKGKPATWSAKVKKALEWTLAQGMTADEIATALCKEIADITESDLPELKVAYGAWKAAKEAPDPTVAPCPDGSKDYPVSYCGTECPRDLECDKKG